MERHGQLHLSETCRENLLSLSVATADRLLRQTRGQGPMASRRREQAPCSSGIDQGSYLCTLTLTDIATSWTECLPLLYKSQENVLEALQPTGCATRVGQ